MLNMKPYNGIGKLVLIVIILIMQNSQAKIMRNNALMQKMITHFQKDNMPIEPQIDEKPESTKLLNVMQNVLCRNFPTIPCTMITQDLTLKKLIEQSIDQINLKKHDIEKLTVKPVTTFSGSAESNFLTLMEKHYKKGNTRDSAVVQTWSKAQPKTEKSLKFLLNDKRTKTLKKSKKKDYQGATMYTGRKKIRKFYPHKITLKGKNIENVIDYSDEKLSMSVEMPDRTLTKKRKPLKYKMEPDDTPVWRIDYLKYGDPNPNMFGYQTDLKDKIVSGPEVMVDERLSKHAHRKEVLQPDVYIKKAFLKNKETVFNSNSE